MRSVRIRRFSGPHFPTFGLNTEQRYFATLRIQSKCGKIRSRKTPDNDTFHAVKKKDFDVKYLLVQYIVIYFYIFIFVNFFVPIISEKLLTSLLLVLCPPLM